MAMHGLYQRARRFRIPILILLSALMLEALIHQYQYHIFGPDVALDKPFSIQCQEPDIGGKRENAVLVMLARNSDLLEANKTITSIEKNFNRWFNYPIVFFNDKEWEEEFINELQKTSGGKATFEVIPQDKWTFPNWIDEDAARLSMLEQGEKGIPHGDNEAYHHMCRFFSGNFFQLNALKKYKWYWRLEPNVDFACSVTYDPFVQMAKHGKVYGFTIALWEVGKTCPSLFREMSDWMANHAIKPTNLWKTMIQASWMPFPFRHLMRQLPSRDQYGDEWSLCHYWNNFEIADMDFFRSPQYQELFNTWITKVASIQSGGETLPCIRWL